MFMPRLFFRSVLPVIGLLVLGLLHGAAALAVDLSQDMVLTADEMVYERQSGIFTATGNVALQYKTRVLHADVLIYRQNEGRFEARGNVYVVDDDGNRIDADEMLLSDDLREGMIRNIHMMFSDGSRLAALAATRSDGNRNRLDHATYSPCKVCVQKKTPLWRIRAVSITHREDTKTIVYRHAVLEFFGIPVAYLPYLSHPDPSVKRRSGFLVPKVGSSSFLGAKLEIPYYLVISPYQDFTFAPLLTTRESIKFGGQYRQRTGAGQYSLDGSITRVDKRDNDGLQTGNKVFRGHIFGDGRFAIDNRTSWGFNTAWSTDDTYLRRYGIDDAETLTSRLFLERIDGRDYFNAAAYGFQGLRIEDVSGQTPFILPWLRFQHISQPGWRGSTYKVDASALVMQRPDGADTRRLSLGGEWRLPLVARFGAVTDITASLRGDFYQTNGLHRIGGAPQQKSHTAGRLAPMLKVDWRLPLARTAPGHTQIIEPIVSLVAAPNRGNPTDIPNEDSQNFIFDNTNLFRSSRFAGLDRFDSGSRINYGMRYSITADDGRSGELMVGESFRFSRRTYLPPGAGLDQRRSDFVGRIRLGLSPYIDFYHSVRLDRDNLALRRNEIAVVVGPRAVRLDLSFLETDNKNVDPLNPDRREIRLATRFRFTDKWRGHGRLVRSLLRDENILAEGGISYQDECVDFGLTIRHNFTRDRELTPSTSVILRLVLKHLG